MKQRTYFTLAFLSLVAFFGCEKNPPISSEHVPTLPEVPFDYLSVNDALEEFQLPQTISIGDDDVETNDNSVRLSGAHTGMEITSDEIVTLGRVLFYDRNLSKNNSIACASCHHQEAAFADRSKVSQGFAGGMTSRNSMSIANPIAKRNFFWDGRAFSLNDLALQPVFNHIEMGIDSPEELVAKVSQEAYYAELFQQAYGSSRIDANKISTAIAQFVGSIFKNDSKFDEGLDSGFSNYSELEKHGMALFFSDVTNCSSCHNGANFASPTKTFNNPYMATAGTTNIGLDLIYEDQGFSDGKFSIPSLRNIALTGPFMHDGRFNSLREVLDHYNDGVQAHKDLDSKLIRNGAPRKMNLTELDLQALEAFLITLTSKTIATDEKYSNPFTT